MDIVTRLRLGHSSLVVFIGQHVYLVLYEGTRCIEQNQIQSCTPSPHSLRRPYTGAVVFPDLSHPLYESSRRACGPCVTVAGRDTAADTSRCGGRLLWPAEALPPPPPGAAAGCRAWSETTGPSRLAAEADRSCRSPQLPPVVADSGPSAG